jgi:hypothetical protein
VVDLTTLRLALSGWTVPLNLSINFAPFADRAYVESVDEYCDDVIEHVQLLKVNYNNIIRISSNFLFTNNDEIKLITYIISSEPFESFPSYYIFCTGIINDFK